MKILFAVILLSVTASAQTTPDSAMQYSIKELVTFPGSLYIDSPKPDTTIVLIGSLETVYIYDAHKSVFVLVFDSAYAVGVGYSYRYYNLKWQEIEMPATSTRFILWPKAAEEWRKRVNP